MRLLLALALAAGIGQVIRTAGTATGVQKLAVFEVYHQADGGYSTEQARIYVDDSGTQTYTPVLAPGDVIVSERNITVCASVTLCLPPDGGQDPVQTVANGCACAVDATCLLTADGGAAPHGQTLPIGSFTGAGCQAKSCTALFLAGPDGTWPAGCPTQ